MPVKWTKPKKAEKDSKRTTASAPKPEKPSADAKAMADKKGEKAKGKKPADAKAMAGKEAK